MRTHITVGLLKIETNQTYRVRFLAYSPKGLFTHWRTKPPGSIYCEGDSCSLHKQERFWKSYQCVELLGANGRLWYPTVLEVTEHLELDFRGLTARGQVWDITRPARRKGKRASLTGVFVETRNVATLRPPFDVVPILRTVFHRDMVEQTVLNPLPSRTLLEPSEEEPGPVEGAPDAQETPVDAPAAKPPSASNSERSSGRTDRHVRTPGPRFY
jgi:hypothetical protein